MCLSVCATVGGVAAEVQRSTYSAAAGNPSYFCNTPALWPWEEKHLQSTGQGDTAVLPVGWFEATLSKEKINESIFFSRGTLKIKLK